MMNVTMKSSTNTETATSTHAPVNQLIHTKQLANAASKLVVTPNVDTVYSQAYFDLSQDAMVFHKPRTERYSSMEMMDGYTNCVAILGTGETQDERVYLIAGPDFSGETPVGITRVDIPTNNAWMLVRTIVKDNEDLENVYAIQAEMKLVPLKAYLDNKFDFTPPKGEYHEEYNYVPVQYALAMKPLEFFSLANELMKTNPPTPEDAEILKHLAKIGVGPGLDFDVLILGDSVEENWKAMIGSIQNKWIVESAPFMQVMGVWSSWGKPIAEFGTEYSYRALIALAGLGANPVSVAVYPSAKTDDTGAPLDGKNAYKIHFNQVPPVKEYGFWSVTAYGEDNFLIDNEINRYAVNDRSSVKYNDDGSLDILLQVQAPKDGTMMGNWLPVKEEPFHLHLRIYLPESSVLNGEWLLPLIYHQ